MRRLAKGKKVCWMQMRQTGNKVNWRRRVGKVLWHVWGHVCVKSGKETLVLLEELFEGKASRL